MNLEKSSSEWNSGGMPATPSLSKSLLWAAASVTGRCLVFLVPLRSCDFVCRSSGYGPFRPVLNKTCLAS